jgi:hypothetical protein
MPRMTDEDFKNLEHTVRRHDGELDVMLKRIEELENDLRLVVRFNPILLEQVRHSIGRSPQSRWANPPADYKAFREQCGKFFEKYRTDR